MICPQLTAMQPSCAYVASKQCQAEKHHDYNSDSIRRTAKQT